jgi:hypothetical protein
LITRYETDLDLNRTQVLWDRVAGCSRGVFFLLFETLSYACAGNVVYLELSEKLEDLIVWKEGSSGVHYLFEVRRGGREREREGGPPCGMKQSRKR